MGHDPTGGHASASQFDLLSHVHFIRLLPPSTCLLSPLTYLVPFPPSPLFVGYLPADAHPPTFCHSDAVWYQSAADTPISSGELETLQKFGLKSSALGDLCPIWLKKFAAMQVRNHTRQYQYVRM